MKNQSLSGLVMSIQIDRDQQKLLIWSQQDPKHQWMEPLM